MVKRVMVAVVCIPLLLLLIYAAPEWALPWVVAALSAIGIYEGLYSTGFLRHRRITAYSMILAALIPFWSYHGGYQSLAVLGVFLYVVALFGEAIASHKKVRLEEMGGAFLLTVMVPLFLSFFLRVKAYTHWRFYILLPFVIAFLSDACALFAGMAFGRHKLAPELSPKKTVEGAIGGLLGATACAMLYGLLAKPLFGVESVSFPLLALYGALGSVFSQLGDLSFSYIKREYGIKDFGDLLPGHGGILDRFDSVIFCAPFVEVMLYIFGV